MRSNLSIDSKFYINLFTSDELAFSDKPAFSSDLLHFVGTTRSSSLIAYPYVRIVSARDSNVFFMIS